MTTIDFEIDGRLIKAKPNQTVIQAADDAGIYIPRFCYHKHLSIPANCRMCLVEVEKSPKALPACSTPIVAGMKVLTQSAKTQAAQRAVMEFLLINHPLDCPICDQGGECELQDLSMGYGSGWSHYDGNKRSVADQNLGPLIATEMTRCIHCTRCVRFGDEIAGMRELGLLGRGEFTEIGTYIKHFVESEVSGNIIDLCPVGALTNKPYRFTARPWELDQSPSISPHDCVGSNLNMHVRYGKVMRVVARENQEINDTWIADRDRYSYAGLYHADRLQKPLIRIEGEWEEAEWQNALVQAASGLQVASAELGADKIGALISPNATLEECYLLQKIMRELGSHHIDHRLRETDISDQAYLPLHPGLNLSFNELAQCDAIILIGTNIRQEQPSIALKVRQAALNGAAIIAINPVDYVFNFEVAAKKIIVPQQMPLVLNELVNSIEKNEQNEISDLLKGKNKICILMGALALHHPEAADLRFYTHKLASLLKGTMGVLTPGANGAGAWLAGAVPHRSVGGEALNAPGLSAHEMWNKPRKAYVLFNIEPELDCVNAHEAHVALKQAEFILAFSQFRDPVLMQYANVILPIAPFTETAGTFVNAAGTWQSFKGVAKSYGASRPGWKVLTVLARFLMLNGFDYQNAEAVKKEIQHKLKQIHFEKQSLLEPSKKKSASSECLMRIGEVPIYATDSLVRRSAPLQAAQQIIDKNYNAVKINSRTAAKLQLRNEDKVQISQHHAHAKLPISIDDHIPDQAVWIAAGISETASLGDLFGEVEIKTATTSGRQQ